MVMNLIFWGEGRGVAGEHLRNTQGVLVVPRQRLGTKL